MDNEALFQAIQPKLEKVEKRGRCWYALCPFHEETRPSLSINLEIGFFKCYGCGKKGTLRRLAEALGILPPSRSSLIQQAMSRMEEAAELVEQLRRIPKWVSRSFGVGLAEMKFCGRVEPAVVLPHPDPESYEGAVFWYYQRSEYRNSAGLSLTTPYAILKAIEYDTPPFAVEGAFDCMSLFSIKKPAIATLGQHSLIPLISAFPHGLILAPDSDAGGNALFDKWINEVMTVPELWGILYVCRWKSKDPNDALRAGTLEKEAENCAWLPSYIIVREVLRHYNTGLWRATVSKYLLAMPMGVREEAVREAKERLGRLGIRVDIPLSEEPIEAWRKVLSEAFRDRELAEYIFNHYAEIAPDFEISKLPPQLRGVALNALLAIEAGLQASFEKAAVPKPSIAWSLKIAVKKGKEALRRQLKNSLTANLEGDEDECCRVEG